MDKIEKLVIYFYDRPCGCLQKITSNSKTKYVFTYNENYLKDLNCQPIALTLPLTPTPYDANKLFPFFEGLISEGWINRIQTKSQRIDSDDYFHLLAKNGSDLAGAVSIILEEKT